MSRVYINKREHAITWLEVSNLEGVGTWQLGMLSTEEEHPGWLEQFQGRYTLFEAVEQPSSPQMIGFCDTKLVVPPNAFNRNTAQRLGLDHAGYQLFSAKGVCYLKLQDLWYLAVPLVCLEQNPLKLCRVDSPSCGLRQSLFESLLDPPATKEFPADWGMIVVLALVFFLLLSLVVGKKLLQNFVVASVLALLVAVGRIAWKNWCDFRILPHYKRILGLLQQLGEKDTPLERDDFRLLHQLQKLLNRLSYVFDTTLEKRIRQRIRWMSQLIEMMRTYPEWLQGDRRHLLECLSMINRDQHPEWVQLQNQQFSQMFTPEEREASHQALRQFFRTLHDKLTPVSLEQLDGLVPAPWLLLWYQDMQRNIKDLPQSP